MKPRDPTCTPVWSVQPLLRYRDRWYPRCPYDFLCSQLVCYMGTTLVNLSLDQLEIIGNHMETW